MIIPQKSLDFTVNPKIIDKVDNFAPLGEFLIFMEKYEEDYTEPKTKSNLQRKRELVQLMGNKCARCNFSDIRALQIDHVNSDGAIERRYWKQFGGLALEQFYCIVAKSYTMNENRYQLLCANCNWIKRSENREFSHGKRGTMRKVRPRGLRIR